MKFGHSLSKKTKFQVSASIIVSVIKNQAKYTHKKFDKVYLIYLPLDTAPIDMGYWLRKDVTLVVVRLIMYGRLL